MLKSFILIKRFVTSPVEWLQWPQHDPVGQLWLSKLQAYVFIQCLTTLPKPFQTFCWIKRSFLWPEAQVSLVEKSHSEILQDVSCCKKRTVKSWIRVGKKRSLFRGTANWNLIWKLWLNISLIMTDEATTVATHLTRCQSKSQLFWNQGCTKIATDDE